MEAATSEDTRAYSAKRFYKLLSGQKEPLEYILVGLMQIAASDGAFHQTEVAFILRVANDFSFSQANIDRLFLIFAKFNGKKALLQMKPPTMKATKHL